jgi:hypothetical protein
MGVLEDGEQPSVPSSREIVIEFFGDEPDGITELAERYPDEVTVVRSKGFHATEFSLHAVVLLAPLIATQITVIVKAHLDARREVRIKADGIELTGLNAKDALMVLRELRPPEDEQ